MRDQNGALSRWLIRHAARRTPLTLADRLAEEWLADCGVRASPASQLRFALGCCWATRVIAREYRPAMIPMVATVRGPSLALGQLHEGRSSLLFLVAGIHVALFYGLMTGLAFRMIATMPMPLQHPVSRTDIPSQQPKGMNGSVLAEFR